MIRRGNTVVRLLVLLFVFPGGLAGAAGTALRWLRRPA